MCHRHWRCQILADLISDSLDYWCISKCYDQDGAGVKKNSKWLAKVSPKTVIATQYQKEANVAERSQLFAYGHQIIAPSDAVANEQGQQQEPAINSLAVPGSEDLMDRMTLGVEIYANRQQTQHNRVPDLGNQAKWYRDTPLVEYCTTHYCVPQIDCSENPTHTWHFAEPRKVVAAWCVRHWIYRNSRSGGEPVGSRKLRLTGSHLRSVPSVDGLDHFRRMSPGVIFTGVSLLPTKRVVPATSRPVHA